MDQRAAFEDTIALMEERIVTVRIDIDRAALDESLWPAHLREMIGAVRSGSNPQDTESDFSEAKLGRWLGWAQASVVAMGLANLEEMKAINKRHASLHVVPAGTGDGNHDHPDVTAQRAIEGGTAARSAISPEWWYAAEDPEQAGDFCDAVDGVDYGTPFQVFGAATVKTVWFARLTPAEDSETDDDWECEAASEAECQALIDAERRRRAAATASTEGAA